jgi:hypothetical protein
MPLERTVAISRKDNEESAPAIKLLLIPEMCRSYQPGMAVKGELHRLKVKVMLFVHY